MITKFDGDYRFLSNFYPFQVKMQGIVFPSVEHAYQASKTLDMVERRKIAMLPTAGKAKRYGQTLFMVYNFKSYRLDVMEFLLRQKFSTNSILTQELVETHPEELVEGNTWGDQFWGAVWWEEAQQWEGENKLGRLLMKIRQEHMWR